MKIVFSIILLFCVSLLAKHHPYVSDPSRRVSSYPYISGDTFRAYCSCVIDETSIPFPIKKLEQLQYADTIFLNANYIDYFFTRIHPYIPMGYILITHNSCMPVPGFYVSYLDDPKLLGWFGINMTLCHDKLRQIPLGVANRYMHIGNIDCIAQVQAVNPVRTHWLYVNFCIENNIDERRPAYDFFTNKPFCFFSRSKGFKRYLADIKQSFFVVSPPGRGIDCFRTWEALLMGAIPVVKTSKLDDLYKNFPILIVHDWSEITHELLEEARTYFVQQSYDTKKLYAQCWFDQIKEYQEYCRKQRIDIDKVSNSC